MSYAALLSGAPSPREPQTPAQGRRLVLAARQTGHRFFGVKKESVDAATDVMNMMNMIKMKMMKMMNMMKIGTSIHSN